MAKTIAGGNSSEAIITFLQRELGSTDFKNWQIIRQPFYSFVPYPLTGTPTLTFFADAVGSNGTNYETTNMPKAGSFGQQHFLLMSMQASVQYGTENLQAFDGTHATTVASDLVSGFVQAGYFSLEIGARVFAEIPRPFTYLPASGEQPLRRTAGLNALTLAAGTPDTYASSRMGPPSVSLPSRDQGLYVVDPPIFIAAEENFQATVRFDSGNVPILATTPITANNPMRVGFVFDGLLIRPVQ
jgi:hypothetical protein